MNNSATPIQTVSTPSRPENSQLSWGQRFYRIRYQTLFLSLSCFGFLALVYFQFTLVTGTEFNTANWNVRGFSFRRDPLSNYQLSGIVHSPKRYSTIWKASDDFSSIDGTIGQYLNSPHVETRWDLAQTNLSIVDGEATVLLDLLSAHNHLMQNYWVDWSKQKPKQASVMWPAVQNLVHFHLYAKLPALFELAMADTNDVQFKEFVVTYVQSTLWRHGQDIAETNSALAREIATVGLSYGDHDGLQDLADL